MKTNHLTYIAIHAVDHCNLSCVFCSNNSPFFKKKQYSFEDYEKWMDILLEKNMLKFGSLSINGGEPFLHKNLKEFASKFKIKYKPSIQLTTNGFWLNSIDEVKKNEELFVFIDKLNISTYPDLQKKYDPKAIDLIKKIFKNKILEIRNVENWSEIKFLKTPSKPDIEKRPICACWTQLLPSGKLAICPTAAYADLNPNASKEFLKNRNDIFFDIKNENKTIKEWATKWPLDACSYCTMWRGKKAKWKNDPKIRKNKNYKKFI